MKNKAFVPCAETDVWRLLVGTAHALSKGQLTYLLYGKELSSSGSYLKLWVKKRLKISFDGKKKLENFDVLGHVNKFCRLKISNYL